MLSNVAALTEAGDEATQDIDRLLRMSTHDPNPIRVGVIEDKALSKCTNRLGAGHVAVR